MSRKVQECTPATMQSYNQRIRLFLRSLGHEDLCRVTRVDIETFLLQAQSRGCSPHYVNGLFRSVRTLFNWMKNEEMIEKSPMRNMKPPRLPRRTKPFVTEAQRDALLALCPPVSLIRARDAAMVWLFWSTGSRYSEISNLKLADLDWEGARIRVFGKGQKERYVPFTGDAQKAIWRYLRFRKDSLPGLWITEEIRPAHHWMLVSAMRRLQDRAGVDIKDMHHAFRRSWAYRNLKAGVPAKYVQLIGGWSSLTMMDCYVKAMTSEDALGGKWF